MNEIKYEKQKRLLRKAGICTYRGVVFCELHSYEAILHAEIKRTAYVAHKDGVLIDDKEPHSKGVSYERIFELAEPHFTK